MKAIILTCAVALVSMTSVMAQVTAKEVGAAAKKFIQQASDQAGGKFQMLDEMKNKQLELTLLSVHDSKLHKIDETTYYVCVDFEAESGHKYEIDFFLQGDKAENLSPSSMMVHKVDGKPRYTWIEENGFYKTKFSEEVSEGRERSE